MDPDANDDGRDRGSISIGFESLNTEVVAEAVETARGAIETIQNRRLSGALQRVVSKLHGLMDICDAVAEVWLFISTQRFHLFSYCTSQVHPYVSLAWKIVSSLYRVMKGDIFTRFSYWWLLQTVEMQLDRDDRIAELAETVEDVYSFVDTVKAFPEKIAVLEDTIIKILKQTVECSFFIREYCGYGFSGM
jgi:hypothetical protein